GEGRARRGGRVEAGGDGATGQDDVVGVEDDGLAGRNGPLRLVETHGQPAVVGGEQRDGHVGCVRADARVRGERHGDLRERNVVYVLDKTARGQERLLGA